MTSSPAQTASRLPLLIPEHQAGQDPSTSNVASTCRAASATTAEIELDETMPRHADPA